MSKRPELGDTELDNYERPLVDDLFALMEDVVALRGTLVFKSQTVLMGTQDGKMVLLAEPALIYQNLAGGDWITAAEHERTREEREKKLRVLEQAMVLFAEAAKERAQRLFGLFREDMHPNRPLAPGAFAANRGRGPSEDDCWERLVEWGERLRDGKYDRGVAANVVHRVLSVLKETYNAFKLPVPDIEQIMSAIPPAVGNRERGPNSIAVAIGSLIDLHKDTILSKVKSSNERHNTVYEFDERGQATSSRVLDQKDWVGATVQEERRRLTFYPMTFASWDGAPPLEPPAPEDWEHDHTVADRRRRLENHSWKGSELVPNDQQPEPERE